MFQLVAKILKIKEPTAEKKRDTLKKSEVTKEKKDKLN